MFGTYTAVLRNGQIEWGSQGPPQLPPNTSVPVQVTVVTATPGQGNGVGMAAALARIAARGGAPEFGDPVEWQIEERTDRPLPGRDE